MSKDKQTVVIAGAGAVGANAALFLNKLHPNIRVILVEKGKHLLGGAGSQAFIEHGDGVEYHREGHHGTGYNCIDSTLLKSFVHPPKVYRSKACSADNPIIFACSVESADATNAAQLKKENSYVPPESFVNNIEKMRQHFGKRYETLKVQLELNDEQLSHLLGRNPETFARRLEVEKLSLGQMAHVVEAYAGTSTGTNIPGYYAHLCAAMKQSSVELKLNTEIQSIINDPNTGKSTITLSTGEVIQADNMLGAAGAGNSDLINKIVPEATQKIGGTHFSNTMLPVILPRTEDQQKIKDASHVNFVLQQEKGCAWTCIKPPSATEAGYGVIYHPSTKGSQIKTYTVEPNQPQKLPEDWETAQHDPLYANEEQRVACIMAQAEHYYPFLKNYATPQRMKPCGVFNIDSPDSHLGLDRRVRQIMGSQEVAPGVNMVWAPKWTMGEMVALGEVDKILQRFGYPGLPRDEANGFGPEKFDIVTITRDMGLNWQQVPGVRREDALDYAIGVQGLPPEIAEWFVPQNLAELSNSPTKAVEMASIPGSAVKKQAAAVA